MKLATRVRLTVVIAVVGTVAALGLAGCGRLGGGDSAAQPDALAASELGWDGQALEAIGFSTEELAPAAAVAADPSPAASNRPGERRRHHPRLRFGFGKRMLHGEAVVQTDEGTKTVVVQRGTVTAIDDTSMTVKSTDGYTITWIFGDPLRVIERRSTVQPSAIKVGTVVGVAGAKDGDKTLARLIVIPIAK
ncbi:MAG TPA: hypothetical protein VF163_22680 [Micromonosporaceae bacterium]